MAKNKNTRKHRFAIGDHVTFTREHRAARLGDVGTVKRILPDEHLMLVLHDHARTLVSPVHVGDVTAKAPPLPAPAPARAAAATAIAAAFQTGDRVEFVRDFPPALAGDRGNVMTVDPGGDLTVLLDNGIPMTHVPPGAVRAA